MKELKSNHLITEIHKRHFYIKLVAKYLLVEVTLHNIMSRNVTEPPSLTWAAERRC